MQFNILKNTAAKAPWLVIHPLSQEDSVTGDRSAHYLSEVTEENATETQMKTCCAEAHVHARITIEETRNAEKRCCAEHNS
jgi:hypothetical protein